MKQREVTDNENVRWTCVQAYSMVEHNSTEDADVFSETKVGNVAVVCTPSGGAKTVRINLPQEWEDKLSDEDINKAIKNTRN